MSKILKDESFSLSPGLTVILNGLYQITFGSVDIFLITHKPFEVTWSMICCSVVSKNNHLENYRDFTLRQWLQCYAIFPPHNIHRRLSSPATSRPRSLPNLSGDTGRVVWRDTILTLTWRGPSTPATTSLDGSSIPTVSSSAYITKN